MLMADLGAEVIKIEAVTGDQMRGTEWAFCGAQRGKRSLALDMKKPGAQAVLERFVREADVMHHNLRLPAAERIGLGPERLRAVNPALVYCHLSSYGPKGPRKDWPGFDQLFQAASGWEYEGAGEGNPPIWHRFGMMDHMGGLSTLFATLLGLYQRAATGEGQFLGSSLLGASLLTVSETLVLPDGTLAPYDRLDADQTGVAPWKRIYRCADGAWIAVSSSKAVFDRALASMGAGAEAAFAARSAVEALAALKDAGVLCAPVRLDQGTAAFFDDPSNRRLRLAVGYRHPVYGHFEQPGALWAFGDLDLVLDRAPPTIGQHTEELLKEYGYASAEIDRLSAEKIVRGVGEEPAVV
jgi:crotonobetainyl-CoA:carnitine CoA-transferase CaiB-like acyl-CoA transferase